MTDCEGKEYLIISKNNSYEQPIVLNESCQGQFYAKQPGIYELYNSIRTFSIGEVVVKDKTFYVNNECNLHDASINNGYNAIIKLLDNIDITIDQRESGNCISTKKTVDLNGKKITIPNKMNHNSYAFRPCEEKAELTITGNGEINCTKGGPSGYPVRVDNKGTVIIENGTFRGVTTVVYVTTGTAIIKGGYYEATPDTGEYDLRYTLNCQDKGYREGTCNFYVYGGTFYRYNPSNSTGDIKDNIYAVFVNENYEVSHGQEKNNNISNSSFDTYYLNYTVRPKYTIKYDKRKYFKGDTVIITFDNGVFCYNETTSNSNGQFTNKTNTNSVKLDFLGVYELYYYNTAQACPETLLPSNRLSFLTVNGIYYYFTYYQYQNKINDIIEIKSVNFPFSNVTSLSLIKNENSEVVIISECNGNSNIQCFDKKSDSNKLLLYITINESESYMINYFSINNDEERYYEASSPSFSHVQDILKYDFAIYAEQQMKIYLKDDYTEAENVKYALNNNEFTSCRLDNSILTCTFGEVFEPKDMIFSIKENNYYYHHSQIIHLATYIIPRKYCEVISFNDNGNTNTHFIIQSSTDNISVKLSDDNTIQSTDGQLLIPIKESSTPSFTIKYNDQFSELVPLKSITYIDNTINGPITLSQNKKKIVIPFKYVTSDKFIPKIEVTLIDDNTKGPFYSKDTPEVQGNSIIYSFDQEFDPEKTITIKYLDNQCYKTNEYKILKKDVSLKMKEINEIDTHLVKKSNERNKSFKITFNVDILEEPNSISIRKNGTENDISPSKIEIIEGKLNVTFDISQFTEIGIYQLKITFREDKDDPTLQYNEDQVIYVYTEGEIIENLLISDSTQTTSINSLLSSIFFTLDNDISNSLFFYELDYTLPNSTEKNSINYSYLSQNNNKIILSSTLDKAFTKYGYYQFTLRNKLIEQINLEEKSQLIATTSFNIEVQPTLTFNRNNYIVSDKSSKLIITIEDNDFNVESICFSGYECTTKTSKPMCEKITTESKYECTFTPKLINTNNSSEDIVFIINNIEYHYPNRVVVYKSINDLFNIDITSGTCLFASKFTVTVQVKDKTNNVITNDKNILKLGDVEFTFSNETFTLGALLSTFSKGEYYITFIENGDFNYPLDSTTYKITLVNLIPSQTDFYISQYYSNLITFSELTCIPFVTFTLQNENDIDCSKGIINVHNKLICQINSSITAGSYPLIINNFQSDFTINFFNYIDNESFTKTITAPTQITCPGYNTINLAINNNFDFNRITSIIVEKEINNGIINNKEFIRYTKNDYSGKDNNVFNIESNEIQFDVWTNYDEKIKVTQICEKVIRTDLIEVSTEVELTFAIRNAVDGDIIKLTNDIVITRDTDDDRNYVYSSITVDLNGHKISMDKPKVINSYAFIIQSENGQLTITGNGEIDTRDGGGYGYPVRVNNKGTVIIENGTFRGVTTVVYVTTGTAIIKGGYYEATPDTGEEDLRYTLNCQDKGYREGTCNFYVYGGTFYRYNPSNSTGDIKDNIYADFVGNSYSVTECEKNDNNYTFTSECKVISNININYLQGDEITLPCPKGKESCTLCYKLSLSKDCQNIRNNKLVIQKIGTYNIYLDESNMLIYSFESKLRIITVLNEEELRSGISKAVDGQIIKLSNNIVITKDEKIIIDKKSITLDMNSKTITMKSGLTNNNIVLTINEGDAIIKGNGIIDTTNNDNYIPIQINKGTLTIENGTFKGKDNVIDITSEGIVYIKGGDFTGSINGNTNNCVANGGRFSTDISNSCSLAGGYILDEDKKIKQNIQLTYNTTQFIKGNNISFSSSNEINTFYYKIKGTNQITKITDNQFSLEYSGIYEIFYFSNEIGDKEIKNILPISTIKCLDENEEEFNNYYQEEQTIICYNTPSEQNPIITSGSFKFGQSQSALILKESNDSNVIISFTLNFMNDSSYNYYKDKIILNNNFDNVNSLSCTQDKSFITKCKANLNTIEPLQLKIGLIGSTEIKLIDIINYQFKDEKTLCQTSFKEKNKNSEITLKFALPDSEPTDKISVELEDSISCSPDENGNCKLSFPQKDQDEELPISVKYNDETFELIEKVNIKKMYTIESVESNEELETQTGQNLFITFKGKVTIDNIYSIVLNLTDDNNIHNHENSTEIIINENNCFFSTVAKTRLLEGETGSSLSTEETSNTILKCYDLNFIKLDEGMYTVNYVDSCSHHSNIILQDTPKEIFIKHVDVPIFNIPRKYFVIENGQNPGVDQSIEISSPNITEDINVCVTINNTNECISIKRVNDSENLSLKWTVELNDTTIGDYVFSYSINNAKEHPIENGEIKLFKTINDFITLPDNLCYFNKDYLSFDFGTDKQISYTNINVKISYTNPTSQIEFIHDNEYPSLYYHNFNEVKGENGQLIITENDDNDNPLYITDISFTNLTVNTKYLFINTISLQFNSYSCVPSEIKLTIGDIEDSYLCTFKTNESNLCECIFNQPSLNENVGYGANKEVKINNNVVGTIFISKYLPDAQIQFFIDNTDITKLEKPLYGEQTIQVESSNYYLPNIQNITIQYEGEENEQYICKEDNCMIFDVEKHIISFKLNIGYNDIITFISINDNFTQEETLLSFTLNGPSFDIVNPYLFINNDDKDAIITFSAIFKDILPTTSDTIYYLDNQSITLEQCNSKDLSEIQITYKCNISVSQTLPTKTIIYVNDSKNKNKIKLYFNKYTIEESCQTILVDKQNNKDIILSLEIPSTLLINNFGAYLTDDQSSLKVSGAKKENTFTFSKLLLSSTLNKLSFTYTDGSTEAKEIFTNTSLLNLYNYFTVTDISVNTNIITSDSSSSQTLNQKKVSLSLSFGTTIHYYNNKFVLYQKEGDFTTDLECTTVEESKDIQSLDCSCIINENISGTFGITYTDGCKIADLDTGANFELVDTTTKESFSAEKNVYFINSNIQDNTTITISFSFIEEYQSDSSKIFYFEDGQTIDCTVTIDNICVNDNNKKVTFNYNVSKDMKKIFLYLNNNKLQNRTIYLVRYSINEEQQCNTFIYSTNDITVTLNYAYEYDTLMNGYLKLNEDINVTGTSQMSTISGDKQVVYTFKQNQFTNEGKYKFILTKVSETNDETVIGEIDESVSFFSYGSIVLADKRILIKEDVDNNNTFTLIVEFSQELDDKEKIILINVDNNEIQLESIDCTSNTNFPLIYSCSFSENKETKLPGNYSISLINQCDMTIPSDLIVEIVDEIIVTIEKIEPLIMLISNENKTITITYSDKITDSISSIQLYNTFTNSKISFKPDDLSKKENQLSFSFTSKDEGYYIVETSFVEGGPKSFNSSQTISFTSKISIKEISLENTTQTDINNIKVYKGMIINYILVTFNSTILLDRINTITYGDEPNNLLYTIDNDQSTLRIDSSTIDFTNNILITINDVILESHSFTIKIDSTVLIEPEKYIYRYDDEKPIIRIKTKGISGLYYIKDNKYTKITKKDSTDSSIYIYEPTLHNEEVYFAFEKDNERKDYDTPIYILNDINTILDLNIDSCIPIFNDETLSIPLNLKNGVKLNINYLSTKYLNSNKQESDIITQRGTYIMRIYYNNNEIIHNETILITSLSFTPYSFISPTQSIIELNSLTCIPQSKYLKIDNSIQLICDEKIENNKLNCNYDSNLIQTYGKHQIIYDNNRIIGDISIYKTLSEAVKIIKPSYPQEGNNLISITSNSYNLNTIKINIETFVEKTETTLSFYVPLTKDVTEQKITLLANENGKDITLTDTIKITSLDFKVNQNIFFVHNTNNEKIEFEINFNSKDDLKEFKTDVYLNDKLTACNDKSDTSLLCSYTLIEDVYEIKLSIKKIWTKSIFIVKYNYDGINQQCTKEITFTSIKNLNNFIFPSYSKNQCSNEKTNSNSEIIFTCKIDFSNKTIKKGDFIVKDETNTKYIINDIEVISFSDKKAQSGSTSILYSNIEEQYLTIIFNESITEGEIQKIIIEDYDNALEINNCNLGSNSKELICLVKTINTIGPNNTNIKYQKKCGDSNSFIDTGLTVTIKNSEKYLSVKEHIIASSSSIKLNVNDISLFSDVIFKSFTFIDIYDSQNIFEITKFDKQDSMIILNSSNNKYGTYFCEAKLTNNESIPVKGNVIIYDKAIQFKDDPEKESITIYTIKGKALNQEISFNNVLFKNRISLDPNNPITISSFTTSAITLVSDNPLEKNMSITITDFSNKNLTVTIKAIEEMSLKFVETYYINKQSSLTFDSKPVFTEYTKIESGNQISFNFENDTKLSIKSFSSSNYFKEGMYLVNFYYNYNSKYISSNKIYFINRDSIPTKSVNDIIYINKGDSSFTIELDKSIKAEYLQYIISESILSPTFTYVNNKKIKVSTKQINGDTLFSFAIFDIKIQIQLKILYCTSPEFPYKDNDILKCVLCKDIDPSKPYFQGDNICLTTCPQGSYIYDYQCLNDCTSRNLYSENGQCVSKCSIDYGRKTDKATECVKCSDLSADQIAVDGICESDCLTGAMININNACILPEKLHEKFPQVDKCENYCMNNGNCTLKNNVPICECPEGYYGPACEIENEKADDYLSEVEDDLFPLINKKTGKENIIVDVRLTSVKVTLEIKQMISYGKKKKSYITDMKEEKKDLITKSTKSILENIISKKEPQENVFHLVGLSLLVHLSKLTKRGLRNLQDDKTIKDIQELMEQAHSALRLLAIQDNKLNDTNSVIIVDSSQELFYQYSKTVSSSLKARETNTINNYINVIDFGDCFTNQLNSSTNEYYVITTDVTESLRSKMDNAIPNTKISVINNENSEIEESLSQCNVICKIALLDGMNPELYNYYISHNIDIYNPEDPAFKNKCYYNKDLDFDLTPSYRRKYLYQQKSITKNSHCSFVDNQKAQNYIILKCSLGNSLDYSISNHTIDNFKRTSNVPIICPTDIDTIISNIGFWIYLVIIICIITFSIVYLFFISKGTNVLIMLQNDGMIQNDAKFSKIANIETVQSTQNNKPQETEAKLEDVKISVQKKEEAHSFSKILLSNLFELHPIFSLSRESIITPLLYNSLIFVFNIMSIFGFNALYLTEGKIEQRIYDSNRDNFGYPVKSEFDKIMSAIASTIVLTLIVKGISLVTYSQKKDLENKIDDGKNSDNTEKEIKIFNQSMLPRRIISWIFMLFVSVFFFYYSIVFCGIYINTQYGWFYSGIWSLFFNWVIFSNVFIFIVSFIEKCNENEAIVYYLKKLFIF